MTKQSLDFNFYQWSAIAFVTITGIGYFFILTSDDPDPRSGMEKIYDDPRFECEYSVKKKLRDSGSYERVTMLFSETISDTRKILNWDFRAKNGFNGYTLSTAKCYVSKEDGGSLTTTIKRLD